MRAVTRSRRTNSSWSASGSTTPRLFSSTCGASTSGIQSDERWGTSRRVRRLRLSNRPLSFWALPTLESAPPGTACAPIQCDYGPPTGRKPTGSGSGGPVRLASARHCTISCRSPAVVYLNMIRPSRSTRSSVADVELHFAQRVYARSCCGVFAIAHAPRKSATPHEPMTTAFNVGGAGRVGRVRERGRSVVWAPSMRPSAVKLQFRVIRH
jgi:hypothetical protein